MRILIAALAVMALAVMALTVSAYAAEQPVRVTTDDLENLKQKDIDPAPASEEPNPLDTVADEMVKAQVKLKQGRTDKPTQISLFNALEMLEKLIEIAQQQQQQQQQEQQQKEDQKQQKQQKQQPKPKPQNTQQSGRQGRRRAQTSQESGRGREGATGADGSGQKGIEWGNLPPRARQEYEQILKEDFPEAYKRLLEQYYQNLSDR